MIQWIKIDTNEDGVDIYQRVDEDGVSRVTAIKGYRELDEYLASLESLDKE